MRSRLLSLSLGWLVLAMVPAAAEMLRFPGGGLPAVTVRSHVGRLRARYRELLRAELRQTVETEEEVDQELRELLRVLTTP